MEQDRQELAAWVSRFWGQYQILPESFKEGFLTLVKTIDGEHRNNAEVIVHKYRLKKKKLTATVRICKAQKK